MKYVQDGSDGGKSEDDGAETGKYWDVDPTQRKRYNKPEGEVVIAKRKGLTSAPASPESPGFPLNHPSLSHATKAQRNR